MSAELTSTKYSMLPLGFHINLVSQGRNPFHSVIFPFDHVSVGASLLGLALSCFKLSLSQ